VRRLQRGLERHHGGGRRRHDAFTAGQAPGFLRCGGATQCTRSTRSTSAAKTRRPRRRDDPGAHVHDQRGRAVGRHAGAEGLRSRTAPATAPSWGSTAATTFPQRSSTLYLLNLSLNTYGGIARWQARYGEEITSYGNTASGGEVILSSKAGTGKSSGHIIFEAVLTLVVHDGADSCAA
jgi:hypothetical protein